MIWGVLALAVAACFQVGSGQLGVPEERNVLTPPYFNIATGKKIESTASCGEDGAQIFCKLTGGPNEYGYGELLQQGQICDYCDAADPTKSHPIKYAIDGTEKWWQSPPLSQGQEYNKINITIHLGQVFHVAYTIIKFANSPRAGTWVLERSSDHGKTYQPWQYFANSDSDCYNLFGIDAFEEITRDDSVICTSEYSDVVPLESGEVIVSMINDRPGAKNFSHSPVLQEWSKATDVRLRLLRTKTLLGHLMAVQRQDPTVTRRYYYSIKDISIGGRCVCNGHADTCAPDPFDKYKLKCDCRHNTCGDSCDRCCPGFVQKAWMAAVPESSNECEPCNCHGHSVSCVYDKDVDSRRLSMDMDGNYDGGGVCVNCTHNTAGINCEKCVDGYYRPADVDLSDPYGCRPCECDSNFTVGTCEPVTGRCYCKPQFDGDRCDRCAQGYHNFPECAPCPCVYMATRDGVCMPIDGECPCKYNYAGMYCDECQIGFYDFPNCIPCACHGQGATNENCDQYTGQCICEEGYGGRECDECDAGYFNYPFCQSCFCRSDYTTSQICDPDSGECLCADLITGDICDQCVPGYFDFPDCKECQCSSYGSVNSLCDPLTGTCECLQNYQGTNCDECAPEYYDYPNCLPCDCDLQGSIRTTCNPMTGQCSCYNHISGRRCHECAPDYFNFPLCEDCKCNTAGIKEVIPGQCLAFTVGQCDCKENVVGVYCDMCDSLHYNMTEGCLNCSCFLHGTLDGVASCNDANGDCWCKTYSRSQRCSLCEGGFFGLEESNYFGCSGCQCDVGGSQESNCNPVDGQCRCKRGATGRKCNEVEPGNYYPSVLQHQYEIEEGTAANGEILRFGYDPAAFPGYSENGYGEFSIAQNEIIIPVYIENSGLYRIYFHYMQPLESSVGEVTFSPVTARGTEQTFEVNFDVTVLPALQPVNSVAVLNSGQWNVIIRGSPGLLVDYFILLPDKYYEPTILQAKVVAPCLPVVEETGNECIMYTHPPVEDASNVVLTEIVEEERLGSPSDAYPEMVYLVGDGNEGHNELVVTLSPERVEKYVLVLEYASNQNQMQTVEALVSDGRVELGEAKFNIYSCFYAFPCRQVALSEMDEVMVFDITIPSIRVELSVDSAEAVYVSRVYAIPYAQWSLEHVEPHRRCIAKEGSGFENCIPWQYPIPATGRKYEAGSGNTTGTPIPTATNEDVKAVFIDYNSTVQIDMDLAPGRYVFLLHYYNPYHLSFSPSIVISGGVTYVGGANVTHCSNGDGCRAIVSTDTGDIILDIINPTQTMTITVPKGKSFWLEYVLAIPEDSYKSSYLDVMPFDYSRKFLEECYGVGSEGLLDLVKEPSDFCRSAVFTLSMDFNDGALSCNCSEEGTIGGSEADCQSYGGKCPCKVGVVGQRCGQCAIGYYGYPDCKQCDCNGTLCDKINGNCICPPNTLEPDCKQCAPFTHSYHSLAGCILCDCNTQGVVDAADLGCSMETGQCRCKENVEGQRCDRCKPGFYSFPDCRPCVCDERGRIKEGCDRNTGQCTCKENVEGQQCDRCKPGTFFLDGNNPHGCTNCFCSNVSSECTSTIFPLTEITTMEGWQLVNMKTPTPEILRDGRSIYVDVFGNGGAENPTKANLYWNAPMEYLHDKLGSYGGILQFTTQSRRENSGRGDSAGSSLSPAPLTSAAPGVILEGSGMIVGLTDKASADSRKLVTLVESNFVHRDTGNPVKRENMMMILSDLRSIRIHASSDPNAAYVTLSDVSLTTTNYSAPTASGPAIPSVEQCICPKGYIGESCQLCDSGHYRDERGLYFGYCLECDCYGHCDQCDANGLIDQDDCLHNTEGDQCEICKDGYIGDPTTKNPDACQICPCPYQTEGGNFAKSCHYDDYDELVCVCEPGYTGSRCELCDFGYHGNPIVIGGKCEKCNCHGNLDQSSELEPCDSLTGECSDCKFNTGGRHCERCVDSYYGDAVLARNCTECPCLECGTLQCDHVSGHCFCKSHVFGRHCDVCEPGYWDLESCDGCKTCDCDIGATGIECDQGTGQCYCAPNVSGMKCDHCKQGHWNFSSAGCEPCNCHSNGDCNPLNGECECPPGIIGRQCDQCILDRYVLPRNGFMCEPCDVCTHVLLDDIEYQTKQARDASRDISAVSAGAAARRRLEQIATTTRTYKMKIMKIDGDMDDLDEDGENLLKVKSFSLERDIGSGSGMLEESSGAFLLKSGEFEEKSPDSYTTILSILGVIEDKVGQMCHNTDDLLDTVEKSASREIMVNAKIIPAALDMDLMAKEAMELVEELSEGSSGDDIEFLMRLTEGRMMLERMKMRAFDDMKIIAYEELALSEEAFDKVDRVYITPTTESETQVRMLDDTLNAKLSKLNEMRLKLNNLGKMFTDVIVLNAMNKKSLAEAKLIQTSIFTIWDEINALSEDSDIALNRGSNYTHPNILNGDALRVAESELRFLYNLLTEELEGKEMLANSSTDKATMLKNDADILVRHINETESDPRNIKAVDGANRYAKIFNAVYQARDIAAEADLDATEMYANMTDTNLEAPAKSLLNMSKELLLELQKKQDNELLFIRNSLNLEKTKTDHHQEIVTDLSDRLDQISNPVEDLSQVSQDDIIDVYQKAIEARMIAEEVLEHVDILQEIVDDAPSADFQLNHELANIEDIASTAPDEFEEVKELSEDLKQRAVSLKQRRRDLDLDDKLKEIKKLITLSRSKADSAKVSMQFKSGDALTIPEYVQPRLPVNAFGVQDFARVEMYVNVSNISDNSLFYWGDTSSSSGDFMALETRNGFVHFNFKVGEGSGEIISTGKISDNKWHKVAIQRIGNKGRLEVELPDPQNDEMLVNVKTEIINKNTNSEDVKATLPIQSTAFVVGGIPFPTLPSAIQNRQMSGCVTALRVNGDRVGLWNFASYNGPQPGVSCPRGPEIAEDNRMWWFRGTDSYLRASPEQLRRQGFVIGPSNRAAIVQFKFSTMQSDALLFLVGTTKDQFFAVELRNGKFVVTCNFGWDEPIQGTVNNFPDVNTQAQSLAIKAGVIKVSRSRIMVVLAINSKLSLNMTFSSWSPRINSDGWVGGIYEDNVPEDLREYVTNMDTHFRGCLGSLAFHFRFSFNMYDATEKVGVTRGCQPEIISTVEVDGDDFISVPSGLLDLRDFTGKLTIQTSASGGTILVARENKAVDNRVTLSMLDGHVNLSDGEFEVRSMGTYDDGQPHSIRFEVFDTGVIYLNIDDTDVKEMDTYENREEDVRRRRRRRRGRRRTAETTAKIELFTSAAVNIFIGGSPDDVNFNGCIGYIQIDKDSRHLGLLTENARCGSAGTVKCTGKPKFNTCTMVPSINPDKVILGVPSTRTGVPSGEVSALAFTNGNMELNGDNADADDITVVDVSPKRRRGRKPARNARRRQKPGTRGQDTVLGTDAVQLYDTGYDGSCQLPLNPASSGFLYPGDGYAKYTVDNFNSMNWRFSLKMRTTEKEGILFFMCTARCPEHVALYLVKGKIVLSVKFGTERRKIRSSNRYNDGDFHQITFQRKAENLQMIIDDTITRVEFLEISHTFSELMLFYIGGVQEREKLDALSFMNPAHARDFSGCVQDLSVNDQSIETSSTARLLVKVRLKSCFEGETEQGIFFPNTEPNEDGAYIIAYNPYYIETNFQLTMEIRPRAQSGVLLAIGGSTGNFLQLTLVEGKVVARVKQETDLLMSVYDPSDEFNPICDGNWHKIEVIKSKNVLTLTVDGNMVTPVDQGDIDIISCDTDGPLYIGGVPRDANVGKLLTSKRQYTGCMRRIRIDDFHITPSMADEVMPGVTRESCPRY